MILSERAHVRLSVLMRTMRTSIYTSTIATEVSDYCICMGKTLLGGRIECTCVRAYERTHMGTDRLTQQQQQLLRNYEVLANNLASLPGGQLASKYSHSYTYS